MNSKVAESLERLTAIDSQSIVIYRDAINQELCTLTESSISYFAAMNLDETRLTMIGWSKTAMGICAVSTKPIVYKLDETGLWGDAVRERKPVITNDYDNLVKPTKKGYPAGHVAIKRHMNLPIFEGDHIVLVVGVGNKASAYTMQDAQNVEEMINELWVSFKQVLQEATW